MILRGLFKVFLNKKYLLILSIFISKVVSDDEDEFHPKAEVHSLDNDRVGNGGAVITIHGRDFAEDTFNQFDPNIGNKIYFSNDYETLECVSPVVRTWALQNPQSSSQTKVTCELPPRNKNIGNSWYTLTMYVDGLKVSKWDKSIEYVSWKTPEIRGILSPRYVKVGDLVSFEGIFYTNMYGNTNEKEGGNLDNDDANVEITGAFVGPTQCELTNELGYLYGLHLDEDEEGNYQDSGNMTCKLTGTYIGPLDIDVYVSDGFGHSENSHDENVEHIDSLGQPFVFHTLADITNVSKNSGSVNGGQYLTISGSGFDANPGSTKIIIGNDECTIDAITSQEIVCKTPPENGGSMSVYPGNAGLKYELWRNTGEIDTTAGWQIMNSTTPDHMKDMDTDTIVREPMFNETNDYTARLYGFFVAPYDGPFKFYVASSDRVSLYFSNTSSPNDAMLIIDNCEGYYDGYYNVNNDNACHGVEGEYDWIDLIGGQKYFIAAIHHQRSSSAENNFLRISMKTSKSSLSHEQHNWVTAEQFEYYVGDEPVNEHQNIQIKGDISNNFYFTMNGVIRNQVQFDMTDPVANWPAKLDTLLNPYCTYDDGTEEATLWYQGAETDEKLNAEQGYHADEYEAYCGNKVVANAWRHLRNPNPATDIRTYKWVCFAYRSNAMRYASVHYKFTNNNGKEKNWWLTIRDKDELDPKGDEWKYTCVDMLAKFDQTWPEQRNPSKPIYMHDFHTGYDWSRKMIHLVDEFRIAKQEIFITRHLSALSPSGNIIPDNVAMEVSTTEESECSDCTGNYHLALNKHNCPTERFSLFGIASGTPGTNCTLMDINSTNVDDINDYLKDGNNWNATFHCDDWPADASITIRRLRQMSLALQGTYQLTMNNISVDVPLCTEPWELEPILSGAWNYECPIEMWGGNCGCGHRWAKIRWDCQAGGDRPDLELNLDNVYSPDNTSIWGEAYKKDDGYTHFKELGPDFFRTPEDAPQVQIMVNDYPAWCSHDDCSYTYDSNIEATVVSIASTSDGLGNIDVTITGSFEDSGSALETDTSNVLVMADNMECNVTSVSESTIMCTFTNPIAGSYNVSVFVKSIGEVTYPSSGLTVDVPLVISHIAPMSGSLGGGTELTITGSGFDTEMRTVTIDGQDCEISSEKSQVDTIVCITPPASAEGTYDVVVQVGSISTAYSGYTYDATSTPTVISLSPSVSGPRGGSNLTITGTAFGTTEGSILICQKDCPIISWSDTMIECTLPANSDGQCTPKITIPGNGYAELTSNNVSPISYKFRITSVSPDVGSIMGGTMVSITGEGFSNEYCNTNITINFGSDYQCIIETCTDTSIDCKTSRIAKTVMVKNTGSHAIFGYGFKWNPVQAQSFPGDTIQWQWTLGSASLDSGINIFQTSSSGSLAYDGSGFHSGPKRLEGGYVQTFHGTGTLTYASDSVIGEDSDAKLTGSIVVSVPGMDDNSYSEDLDIKICTSYYGEEAVEALHVPGSGNSSTFAFQIQSSLTPIIDNIAIDEASKVMVNHNRGTFQGTNAPTFTFTGQGFSATPSENQIMIGDTSCTIITASETEINCTMSETLDGEATYLIKYFNEPNGYGIIGSNSFAEYSTVSYIDSISPVNGSKAGAGDLTITGKGFISQDDVAEVVFVGDDQNPHACKITNKTDDQIICTVPSMVEHMSGDVSVSVYIRIGNKQMPPAQSDGLEDTFKYNYLDSLTPHLDSLDQNTISEGAGSLTLSASGIYSGDTVKIFLIPSNSGGEGGYRRKRSTNLHEHLSFDDRVLHTGLKKRRVSEWFEKTMNARNLDELSWRTAGSAAKTSSSEEEGVQKITRRDLDANPKHSGVALVFNDPYQYDPVLSVELEEEHWGFVARHSRDNLERSLRRHKRSIYKHRYFREVTSDEPTCYEGTVTSVTNDSITADFSGLPAGEYFIQVVVVGVGAATNNETIGSINNQGSVDDVTPSEGSTYGGQTITITGNGFHSLDKTQVVIGGTDLTNGDLCVLKNVTSTTIICVTGSNGGVEALNTNITIYSGDIQFPSIAYSYSTSSTPTITSVSPTSADPGSSVSLTGTMLDSGSGDLSLALLYGKGKFECNVTNFAFDTPIVPGGIQYALEVHVPGYGYADTTNKTLDVNFDITTVSPIEGSKGGGSEITIYGVGFNTMEGKYISVTICDEMCPIIWDSVQSTELKCLSPIDSTDLADNPCDVVVSQGQNAIIDLNPIASNPIASDDGVNATSPVQFTYRSSLTPALTSVSPISGGSGGGTSITITGSGFATTGNEVAIDGSICDITSESETEIQCDTNSHVGSGVFLVEVTVPGKGGAANQNGSVTFRYVDRWSSIWTWGGLGTPQADEFIVIQTGQEIVLDVTTPTLAFLLLDGGTLIFDRDQNGLTLHSEYILLLKDGRLEVGTEEEPYLNQANIMLHGHVRCIELPVFGCKVLAARSGTIELHGKPINNTWTHLAQTADAGATEITTILDVSDWEVGDEVIIPTTSHRHSMGENEKVKIAAIGSDGKTLTLEEPLKYTHIAISQTFGSQTVETRAEVGRLSRNVRILGSVSEEFLEVIPACEKSFDSNQFATQSCFNGKFGEELGSDEFGAVAIFNPKVQDSNDVKIHITYTEVFWAGQAFRTGRYPIHFHLMGNINGSYVKGAAIHNTFNRAMTLHGISNFFVERTVTFDVKGLSFFIEDGIEENNIIRQNLAVYTKQSSSLLNPDVTPAAFWVVNPNNHLYENAAAGGTHFGYWYRIQRHPDGPSETNDYCSNNVPLGTFRDNSAHTFGWYGLWIFSMAGYFPMDGTPEDGYCNGQNMVPAVYERLTAWKCERGAELVFGGPIQFKDFVMLDNEKAGVDFVEVDGIYGDDSRNTGAFGGLIVGHSDITEDNETCTHEGFNGPKLWGSTINGTSFYNFDRPSCFAIATCSQCTALTASFPIVSTNLTFENSPNKVTWRWQHSGSVMDLDGSLTGTAGYTAIPSSTVYPPECIDAGAEFSGNDIPGSICDDSVVFSRIAFNHAHPDSLQYNPVIVTTEHGNDTIFWRKKDITHKAGWNGLFPQGTPIKLEWQNHTEMTNISYDLSAWQLDGDGRFVLIQHNFNQVPDGVGIIPGDAGKPLNQSLAVIPNDTNVNGDWHWENSTLTLTYILSDKTEADDGIDKRRRKRGLGLTSFDLGGRDQEERRSNLDIYRCFYEDCLPPAPPSYPTNQPDEVLLWSEDATWTALGVSKPVDGDDLDLPENAYLIVDEVLPRLGVITLYQYATLELKDSMDHVLNCSHIFLHGGQLIAGEVVNDVHPVFQHSITINLLGDTSTYDMPLPNNGPVMGAKAIGVFGRLILKGQDTTIAWTKLGATANKDSNTLVLTNPVDWTAGASIVVSTSSFLAHEAEKLTIENVSDDGLTITTLENLKHDHVVISEDFDGESITLAPEVGLLSRKIKIVGAPFDKQEEKEFGCRVIVGQFSRDGVIYTGYAVLENVEFFNCGQRGFTENYDPRYSLAFLNTGNKGSDSIVRRCSFNHNYNFGLGVFGTEGLLLEENVMYRALGNGMIDEGTNNKWHRNLVVYVIFQGIHLNQPVNFEFDSCFKMLDATMPELIENVAAGCERGGIHSEGEPCDTSGDWATTTQSWSGNEVHGTMHGVRIKADRSHLYGQSCGVFSNFLVWKAYDFGFYITTMDDFSVVNSKVLDSGNGVVAIPFSPPSKSHSWRDFTVTVKDSIFVGTTSGFDCSSSPPITHITSPANWPRDTPVRNAGIVFSSFGSGGIGFGKPWYKPKNYNAIRGQTVIDNIKFFNYGNECSAKNVALRTNPAYEDLQHPIIASGISYFNVPEDNIVYFDNPSLSAVNPSDCVDFPCDAKRKALILDVDGSVTMNGIASTIIPDNSFQWEGDKSYGLGYYRVPKAMVTTIDGDRIPYATAMPNLGIVQNGASCSKNNDWNAVKCSELEHRLLVIESMDKDTEVRRLSPVAVLSENGYIDLVNGPQDHGWCFGYTCQERLSTFHVMIALGQTFEIAMTSTPAQHLRYHLLNSGADDYVVVKFWYPKQQRYDVFVNGIRVDAENGVGFGDAYDLEAPDDSYIPTADPADNPFHGKNYYDPKTSHLYVVISGANDGIIDVIQQPVVVFQFGGTVSNADFFDVDPVGNIAGLLGIPANKIRIADIVRENSRRRRKRSTGESFEMTLEIISPASPSSDNATETGDAIAAATDAVTESMNTVLNNIMTGNLTSDAIAVTSSVVATVPDAPPEDPPVISEDGTVTYSDGTTVSQEDSGETFSDKTQAEDQAKLEAETSAQTVAVPTWLFAVSDQETTQRVYREMEAKIAKFKILDDNYEQVVFPEGSDPWSMECEVLDGPGDFGDNSVITTDFDQSGMAEVTISLDTASSDQYSLSCVVIGTDGAPASGVASYDWNVLECLPRPLGIVITDSPMVEPISGEFSITVAFKDEALDEIADPGIGLPVGVDCNISLADASSLNGDNQFTMDHSTGSTTVTGLSIDNPGSNYTLEINCLAMDDGNYYLKTNIGQTSSFVVHAWPDTATVRKQSIGLKYSGPMNMVTESINAFNHVMVENQDDITIIDLETGEQLEDTIIDLSKFQLESSPVCYPGKTCDV